MISYVNPYTPIDEDTEYKGISYSGTKIPKSRYSV